MRQILFGLTLLLLAVPAQVFAGDHGHGDHGYGDHGYGDHGYGGKGGSVCCPKCAAPCQPTVSKGTETKHCWDVECAPICIPKVTFPWQRTYTSVKGEGDGAKGGKGCGCDGGCGLCCVQPKCGRVKYVKKLMRYEYECSVCEYSFDVDAYKNGNGKGDNKMMTVPAAPTEADTDAGQVPPPPPVEARRPRVRTIPTSTHRAPQPVRRATTATKSDSFTEIMAGFFK